MIISGSPAPELQRALTIAASLHDEFSRQGWFVPGATRHTCILASRTAVEFFRLIGLEAECRPVRMTIAAGPDVLTVGDIFTPTLGGFWNGHLVAVVGGTHLVDLTLGSRRRSEWLDLPSAAAVPVTGTDTLAVLHGNGWRVEWRSAAARTDWRDYEAPTDAERRAIVAAETRASLSGTALATTATAAEAAAAAAARAAVGQQGALVLNHALGSRSSARISSTSSATLCFSAGVSGWETLIMCNPSRSRAMISSI